MTLRSFQITLWITVTLAAIGAIGIWTLRPEAAPGLGSATSFRPAFALADAEGRVRTAEEFSGTFLLVFFGFTNCPDVCPTTLSEVATVMDELGSDADRVQPLFISIDPKRDRALGLTAFTQAFHPAILPLAGDAAATAAAANSFKIFFELETDAAAPDGYSMAHSPALYLVGPDGEWLRQFTYGTPATDILGDLKARL